MTGGGARTRWLLTAALALLLAVLGGGFAFRRAIFENPADLVYRRQMALTTSDRVGMLARNHAGPGPCLRYPTLGPKDLTDLAAALEELVQHGFVPHAQQVTTLVRAWAEEQELSSHTQSRAEEDLAMLREGAGMEDRLAFALHGARIRATLEVLDAPVSPESRRDAEGVFDAASLEELTAIWKKYEHALGGYPFPVGDRLVEQLSRDHVDALAELVRCRALLDRKFPASLSDLDGATGLLLDAWGDPILYEPAAASAKVSTRKKVGKPTIEREIPLPKIAPGCDGPPPARATVPGMFLDSALDDDRRMTYPGDYLPPRPDSKGLRIFRPGVVLTSGGVCDGDILVSVAGEPWPDHLAQLRPLLSSRSEVEVVLDRGPAEYHALWQVH
jgi:hypothetical protein